MKRTSLLLVAAMLVLILASAACGGKKAPAEDTGAGQNQLVAQATQPAKPTNTPLPTATPTLAPSPTPSPEPTALPTEAQDSFDPSTLTSESDLSSFKSAIEMTWEGTLTNSQETKGSMNMAIEFVREPLAEHISISGDMPGLGELQQETGGEGAALEIYIVDGKAYMNLFGSWMQAPADQNQFKVEDMAFNVSDSVIKDLKGVQYKGKETINGIETKHYTFDEAAMQEGDFGEGSKIDDAEGDLYVAVEGNYLVRLNMTMTGSNFDVPTSSSGEAMQNGTFTMKIDMSSINEPFEIKVPDEALEESGGPKDIPVADDAADLATFGGMTTYTSAKSPSDLAEFYKAEMLKNGWTESNVSEFGDVYSLEYTKDTKTASIMITTDSQTNKTSVLITVTEK